MDVKPLGPVQLYVAPAKEAAVRLIVAPTHKGLLLAAVATGLGFKITVVVAGALLLQPLTFANTE